jgi:hypothetical protein
VSIVGDVQRMGRAAGNVRCGFRRDTGIWEIFAPGHRARASLQVRDHRQAADGLLQPLKADPFAFGSSELRPKTCLDHDGPNWSRSNGSDEAYIARLASSGLQRGASRSSIYEVHARLVAKTGDDDELPELGRSLPSS